MMSRDEIEFSDSDDDLLGLRSIPKIPVGEINSFEPRCKWNGLRRNINTNIPSMEYINNSHHELKNDESQDCRLRDFKDSRSRDFKDSRSRGYESQGNRSRGYESQGNRSRGYESQDSRSRGYESQNSRSRGYEFKDNRLRGYEFKDNRLRGGGQSRTKDGQWKREDSQCKREGGQLKVEESEGKIEESEGKVEESEGKGRYQRIREIRNIRGFIVNIHDSINFDIDLDMSGDLHNVYRDVISNYYTYQDLNFMENAKSQMKVNPSIGKTYRCRLKGIGINPRSEQTQTSKIKNMGLEVRQLIDRSDGWIHCTLSNIDIYQRLLIDIIIHTSNGDINLREYLLNRMVGETNPIYYPYSRKRKQMN